MEVTGASSGAPNLRLSPSSHLLRGPLSQICVLGQRGQRKDTRCKV